MSFSKRILFLCLFFLIFGSMFLYSGGAKEAQEKTYLIRAHYTNAMGEPQTVAAERFKEIVEEKTNGKVKVEIYPQSQLGGSNDVLASVQDGTVQMANVTGPMINFVPEVLIFELPFMFENKKHLNAVLDDSKITAPIISAMEKKGFHVLGFEDVGVRHIMTTKKTGPINSMQDLSGKKIRLMENNAHLEAFRAFGAAPLPMAYGELYTALEQNVIDGAEAANINYYSMSFYEPAPNWAVLGWINLIGYTVMSKQFYDDLPEKYQKIIDDASFESTRLQRQLYATWEIERLDELKKKGVKVTTPDPEPFRAASMKVYQKYASDVGGMDLINSIRNYKY